MKKLGLVFRDVSYCTRHGGCVWIGEDDGSRERTREGPFIINFNHNKKEYASTANL
jgi:hypothetical protein